MQKRLTELATQAKIGMVSEPRLEEFAKLIIEELANAVEETGKQCAYTSYDLGVVDCTIAKCVDVIKTYFKDES